MTDKDEKLKRCFMCGKMLPNDTKEDKKNFEAHKERCRVTIIGLIDDLKEKTSLLFVNDADVTRHISVIESCLNQIEKKLNIKLDRDPDKAKEEDKKDDGTGVDIKLKHKDGELYKVDKDGKMVKVVTSDLIEKIIKRDLKSL